MSTSSEEASWISWFCGFPENKVLCEVPEDYIRNKFHLTGLSEDVPHYKQALEVVLDLEPVDESENDRNQPDPIKQTAKILYGMIHARYILTNRGMAQMIEKYRAGDFGICPRVFCESQPMLPVGLSDVPGGPLVKFYCPKCMQVYLPKVYNHRHPDGAYFGKEFPHRLLKVHPELKPRPPTHVYLPRFIPSPMPLDSIGKN